MDLAPATALGAIRSGLLCRCPNCGQGALFGGLLRVKDRCEACGFNLKAADSGDGPAVFVILIAGFIACFGMVFHEVAARPPWWLLLLIWPLVGLIACLALLRPAKSLLIALQFHNKVGDAKLETPLAKKKIKGGGFSILTLILVIVGVAILCGLGTWQVRRLQWKTQMLSRIAALQYAPSEPLNVVLNHLQAGRDVDFVRVETACEPAPPAPAARIYTVTEDGPGWRPIVLCRLNSGPYGAVLLDLGIEADAAKGTDGPLAAPARITGVLRTAPKQAPFMATPVTGPGEFGWRDTQGAGAYLGASGVAPAFLMLEHPAVSPTIKPLPAPADIPNNHLGYAITWFGLAAALIAIYVAALIRRRKPA